MTVIGFIILVVAVGLLIAGFARKALLAVVACFIGSIACAILFDGVAMFLFWTGVIAFIALLFSKAAARLVVVIGVIVALFAGLLSYGFSVPEFGNDSLIESMQCDVVPDALASAKADADKYQGFMNERTPGSPEFNSAQEARNKALETMDALSNRQRECAPQAAPTAAPTPQDLGLSDKDASKVAKELSKLYVGYAPGELAVGGGPIPDSVAERGQASFTKNTIETRKDLVKFFASSDAKARSARNRVEQALRKAGYGDAEVRKALTSGDRWIWVSPTVTSQVLGTTYFLNGDIVNADTWRQVAPNDAIWFYVTSDAKIVAGAAVRADCGNPEVDKVRPVRPDTPPAPPIECAVNCKPPTQPPTTRPTPKPTPTKSNPPPARCPDGKPINRDGTCPKDPKEDVNVNPSVPPEVTGPGTTPVGTDPGPATKPTDSPTGCNGPCPRPTANPGSTPRPTPVATERPQGDPHGGSGNGGATQGPGPVDNTDSGQTTAPQPSRDTARPSQGTTGPPPPAEGPQDCGTGNPDDC